MRFKEEIKAAYGYGKVYSVQAVSRINALNCFTGKQERSYSERKGESVKFEEALEKSLKKDEVACSVYGHGKTGAYEEYLYLKREYRH